MHPLKRKMQDPELFADAFNYLLHDGRQVVRPEELHEMMAVKDRNILSYVPDYRISL